MIDATMHRRNTGNTTATLPCVPFPGMYVRDAQGLWTVASVVLSGPDIHVYLAKTAADWGESLVREWGAWTQPAQEINAEREE